MTTDGQDDTEPAPPAPAEPRPGLVARLDLVAIYVVCLALAFVPGQLDRDLPNYARALVATALLLVLPGLGLFRLLAPAKEQRLPRALASAIPLGAVPLVPGMAVAFLAGLSIEVFLGIALATAGLIVVASAMPFAATAGTTLRERWSLTPGEETLGLILLVVAVSPVWLRFDLSRDFDDWWSLGYVRQYRDADSLRPGDPMAGPDGPISGRAATNAWMLAEGAVTRLGDLDPVYYVQTFLPPLLLAAALLAAFALTKRLTGSEGAGQWAVFFIALAAAIDVLAPEGLGRMLLVRAAQDKVVAGLLATPVALLLLLDAIDGKTRRSMLAIAVAAVALIVIHPHGLALAGTAAAGVLGLEWLAGGIRRPGRSRLIAGGAGIAVVAVVAIALWLRVADETPGLFDTGSSPRPDLRVAELPLGLSMAHPGIFRNPLLIAAILLTLPLLRRWRSDRGVRVMLALAWLPIVVTLIPPLSTLAGRVVSPGLLWRFTWLVPVGPVLGYWAAATLRHAGNPFTRRLAGAGIAAGIAAAAMSVQEVSVLGDPAYHSGDGRTKDSEIVIVRSWRYVFDEVQRATDTQKELLRAVTRRVPAGSVVAADPFLSRAIVAYQAGIIPFAVGNVQQTSPAVRDRNTLLESGTPRPLRRAIIERNRITHVIVPVESAADADLAGKRGVSELFRGRRYALFRVEPVAGAGDPVARIGSYALWRAIVDGADERRPARIFIRTVWTSSAIPATGDQVVADLVDGKGVVVGKSVSLRIPDIQLEVPFGRRFIFAVPPGEGDYVARVAGLGGEPIEIADVSVSRGAGGVEIFVNPRGTTPADE